MCEMSWASRRGAMVCYVTCDINFPSFPTMKRFSSDVKQGEKKKEELHHAQSLGTEKKCAESLSAT